MSNLYVIAGDVVTDSVNAPRASAGASLTVSQGTPLGAVWPQTLLVIRGGAILTVLTATARSAKVLTISGAATGWADAALKVGDGLAMVPSASGTGPVKVFTLFQSVGSGDLAFPTLHDAAAPSPSVYLSLDQLDGNSAPYLVRKDAAGNLNVVTDAAPG